MASPTDTGEEGAPADGLVVAHAGDGETLGQSPRREVLAKLYVLKGELTFVVDGETQVVGEGGFVAAPPMVVHTFRNAGPVEARFLNVHAPSKGFIPHLRAMRDAELDEDRRRAAELFDSVDP